MELNGKKSLRVWQGLEYKDQPVLNVFHFRFVHLLDANSANLRK